uniref:Digestive cysteine proteinase 1 n=1 Tax=Aceria tosichella TaxID=561515 RepID=A0A6G1SIP1_9ACAR
MASSIKIFALALVGLVLVVGVLSHTEDERAAWEEFKREFNKSYDREEDQRRMEIFLDNRRFIESQNRATTSFKTGINHLSDLTTDEINKSRTGFRMESTPANLTSEYLFETLLKTLDMTNFTDESDSQRAWYEQLLTQPELDWRDRARVSRVKDQGDCGACWAFATTGALEGILAARGRPILLSEQNLVDCSRRYGNNGCAGGLMDRALSYVRDYGIMSAASYPYTAKDEQCKARRNQIVMRARGSMRLPRGNEALLRVVLALTGPLPVAIDASYRSFHSYKSGVYDERLCKSASKNLNHAVLLVGYGTTENGGDYWILKNSWGRSWGEDGYIRMARNKRNLCGVASYAVLPIV